MRPALRLAFVLLGLGCAGVCFALGLGCAEVSFSLWLGCARVCLSLVLRCALVVPLWVLSRWRLVSVLGLCRAGLVG